MLDSNKHQNGRKKILKCIRLKLLQPQSHIDILYVGGEITALSYIRNVLMRENSIEQMS